MIRISTIFVAICMAMIAASLGLVLYAVAGVNGQQSAIVALAAMTFMILYNAVSMRMRDRPDIDGQIGDLSQGTADLARQVGDFGRRLAAIEGRVMSANSATQDRMQSVAGEISELGMLVNQIAQSVAAHDDVLSSGLIASGSAIANETTGISANATPQARPVAKIYAPPRPAPAPVAVEDDYVDADLDALPSDGETQILAAVRNAIDANRIDIYLQPIVTLPQRKVRFYEAVTRLRDDNDEILTADDFIETAESAGLMGRIDHMVMLRSVQVLRRLMVRNKDVGVFCNVAAATLSSPANFAQCLDFLESSRAVASSLILEFKQAAFRGFGAVEREHLAAGARVEVAGRFVGEDDVGPAGQRPGTGDPLLLAAGQLARPVVEPVAQTDGVDDPVEPRLVRLATGEVERQRDVLQRGERWYQVEGLEDEPDAVAPQLGEPLVVERGQLRVTDEDLPAGRRVEPSQAVHQRGLAGAGRPHDRGELAGGELHGHVVEGDDAGEALAVDLGQVPGAGGGAAGSDGAV